MDASLLLAIGLLLALAKILGELFERFHIAPVIGYVLSGIILSTFFGITTNIFLDKFLLLGIIFLLFLSGLGVKFEDIKEKIYTAGAIGTLGGLVSFAFGFAVGWILFPGNMLVSLAIGAALVTTSNGSVFSILMKIGEFKTQIGRMIVSISVADDILGILFLSFFTVFVAHAAVPISNMMFLFFIALGFYLVLLTVGTRIFNIILQAFGKFIDENIFLAVPITMAIFVSIIAENIGLGIATGAFLAGMAMAKSQYTENIIVPKIKIISDGFIIPLFFAIIGTLVALKDLNITLFAMIFAAAVMGKIIGCGLVSRLFGYYGKEAKLIGLSMIPRGDYNIVVAQIALALGAINGSVFTALVAAIILTIIVTPLLIRAFVRK